LRKKKRKQGEKTKDHAKKRKSEVCDGGMRKQECDCTWPKNLTAPKGGKLRADVVTRWKKGLGIREKKRRAMERLIFHD